MIVARASTFTCISPESLLASGAGDEATEGVVGATSGSSEGHNRFERQEFVTNVRFLGGIADVEKSYRKDKLS